jgi:hypothetical protein
LFSLQHVLVRRRIVAVTVAAARSSSAQGARADCVPGAYLYRQGPSRASEAWWTY